MTKLTKAFNAACWLYAVDGRTQVDAATLHRVTQGAVSNEAKMHRLIWAYCEAHPSLVEAVQRERDCNGVMSLSIISKRYNISVDDVSRIITGLRIAETRNAYRAEAPVDPVQAMRARCATMARMIGGDAGESLAQAIESLPT